MIKPDILVVSRTFFPKEGGIEEYVYNRCLQDSDRIVVAAASCAEDRIFDETQPFSVHRWWIPAHFPFGSLLGSLTKQFCNLFGSLILSIRLYLRYRYRYLEWGHGYDFPTLLLLSYLLPVRCYLYLHGNDLLCPLRNPLLKLLFSWTIRRSQGVICNSSFTQDYLKAHFHVDTPTWVINPSVRESKFGDRTTMPDDDLRAQVRKAHNIPKTSVVILSVGRLVRRKGFDRVISNLPLLVQQGLNVHYIICGQGAMETELRALAGDLEVEDRVHFAGYVSNESLASYYIACDLFAMLTFFDAHKASIEGFGIVYCEAGYFGKPVIASRVGGVVDAVYHEENGLLVDPSSTHEVTAALRQLCQNKQLRESLGCKGQELAKRITLHSSLYSFETQTL